MTMARRKARGRTGVSLGSAAVAAFAALALLLPAAASAHHVSGAVPDCTSIHVTYVSTQGTSFSGTVYFNNGTVAATWNHVAGVDIPASGTIAVPYTAPAGPFSLSANWQFSTGESGSLATASMTCSTPPPPPPPPAPPAAPPAVAPATTAPASEVAGVQAQAPARVARVAVAPQCASRVARVTVTGRSMRDVTLFVNGKRVKTIRIAAGRRVVRTSVPIAAGAPQRVTARVRFRNGAAPRTLVNRAVRCAQTAVQPQSTG
jgi:hypothetical protein